jgi:glutamate-1-semialdehyde aminotransferase
VWDVDGNEYVDFILALGAVTLGYRNREVDAAVAGQLKKGCSFSQATVLEVELAERLVEVIPCAQMVRFLKNGSDATSAAVRLARAATGRPTVAVCGYHGMDDWYIASTGFKKGIPPSVRDDTVSFVYNEIGSLKALFEKHPGRIGTVILEPVQGDGPREGFLESVRDLARKQGAVLIFDEVVSGFRIALGGAQEYYGVVPDLAAVGKGMANGLALSAVVGRTDLMKQMEDEVFISTTFGGEALALAAALKTVEILQRKESLPRIWELSTRFRNRAVAMIREKDLQEVVRWTGLSPHGGLLFRRSERLKEELLFSVFQQSLIQSGMLTTGINNFCLGHTQRDIDAYTEALSKALGAVVRAIERGTVKGLLKGPAVRPVFRRN